MTVFACAYQMASSLPPLSRLCLLISPSLKSSFPPRVSIRVQRFRDDEGQGPSSNVVDANLGILRKRIEVTKVKERLEQCCRYEAGWDYTNYTRSYVASIAGRRSLTARVLSENFELARLVFGNIGLTLVGGTLLFCITSLFTNLCLKKGCWFC